MRNSLDEIVVGA